MSTTPFSERRFRLFFGVSWLVWMIDHALLLYSFHIPVQDAVIDSLLSNLLLFGSCLLILLTVKFYATGTRNYINVIVLCIVLTLFWLFLSSWLLELLLEPQSSFIVLEHRPLIIRGSIGFLISGIVAMIGIVWYNWQDQQKAETRKTDAERLAREAELYKLRQQLQPHFLFNSLNSINALIAIQPDEARKMVQQLSDFLRGTLRKEETQWVSLREELEHLQLYLDIEKVRFGNRLSTDISCDDKSHDLRLPALLLQPIVENAIKFGLYDTTGDIVIRIQCKEVEGKLVVSVTNPFDPETSSPKKGTGFGLSSVKRRLYLLFARNDLLQTHSENDQFTCTIQVPQVKQKESQQSNKA